MEFEWDDSKAETNLAKHGVSFQEAASVFDDALSITFLDPDHSVSEERLIISARETTRRERKVYESVR